MSKRDLITNAVVYDFENTDLNFRTVRSVMKDIRALAKDTSALILNFESVAHLDSHALLFVLAINTEMQSKNGELQLKNLSHSLQEVLSLTQSDRVLEVI